MTDLLHRTLDSTQTEISICPRNTVKVLAVGMYIPVFMDTLTGMVEGLQDYVSDFTYPFDKAQKKKLEHIINTLQTIQNQTD